MSFASHKVEVVPEANLMVIDMVPPERKEEVVASLRKTIAQDHTADEQVQQTAASGDVIALTPEESDELKELSMQPTYDWHSETVQGPSSPPGNMLPQICVQWNWWPYASKSLSFNRKLL